MIFSVSTVMIKAVSRADSGSRLRVAMVTNIPAPYRLPVYEAVAADPQIEFKVFFCSGREPDREWDLGRTPFAHSFLGERFVSFRGRYIHFNHDVWKALDQFAPDVVVTTGFNPTHLIAYAWARIRGAAHVAMTDGTLESEAILTPLHRWIRQHIYARSVAFIAASEGGMRLYRSYGVGAEAIFKSHLCADNELFFSAKPVDKRYDFIFCSRFVALKNPFFALEVAREAARRIGRRISIVLLGSGELGAEMQAYARTLEAEVDTTFAGFARQEDLPQWYGASRIFLFPTSWDPWGVVANEACAAGVPVLVSPAAGSAAELVRHGENGFVLPLDKSRWADMAVRLLTDEPLYSSMAARARDLVAEYNYGNAARGIVQAVRAADSAYPVWSSRKSVLRRKVVVIQRRMTHYRVPLFNLMRDKLDAAGIDMAVVYGNPAGGEILKGDSGFLPWGIHLPARYLFNTRACWQNAWPVVRNADLVVITQENGLLFNYVLAILHGKRKWAFWGHGRNFQSRSPNSLRERFKRWLAGKADWWFAYTSVSRATVLEAGFPPERLTLLNNAIDTTELASQLASLDGAAVEYARREFGVGTGRVCLSLGSLHSDKRLDFLFEAARHIRERVPDFQLVVIGDGPQRDLVEKAASDAGGWIHWLGARSGRDKALALAMSELMLNPGMVGLSVVDAFVAGVPMVTTSYQMHSPEIAYLESGMNGLITDNNTRAFAAGVTHLLADVDALEVLRNGCRESALEYTLDHMAENFCNGIVSCLSGQADKAHSGSVDHVGATS